MILEIEYMSSRVKGTILGQFVVYFENWIII